MKISKLFLETLKEVPSEAEITSHQLMLRAGLIRKLSSGLYTFLPLGFKVLKKVEKIVREEMDRTGALEYLPPILIPRELWEESGRYHSMGDLMMKMRDRHKREFILGPTHEEVFTDIVRSQLKSYKDLPVNVYQINTKFRDELRPRFGVMRSREFIMKDAYSFHTSDESLDETYQKMGEAYRRMFFRCGLDTVAVRADSGAMGGSGSEEFMVRSDIGDDTIIECPKCHYISNQERAECAPETVKKDSTLEEKAIIDTPDVKTIEELTDFLNTTPKKFIKTLVYQYSLPEEETRLIMAIIRGDLEVNEVKLVNALGGGELILADDMVIEDQLGIPVGFMGAINIPEQVKVFADESVRDITNGITGANVRDKHIKGIQPDRDLKIDEYRDLRLIVGGEKCPICKAKLTSFRGIEVGHIFKLGKKYTESLKVSYLDEAGNEKSPTMGCYGVGVSRTIAAIIDQNNDKNGILWPMSVAPYTVVIIPVNASEEKHIQTADSLYDQLQNQGVEVLYDDREARAGFKFKDADLIGIPIRITIGDKSLKENSIEYKLRWDDQFSLVPLEKVVDKVIADIEEHLKKLTP